MAKRNSTKTATKEALQSSEPKMVTFQHWNGINIQEVPSGWSYDSDDFSDGVLKNTFLTVQDNVDTTDALTLETRDKEQIIVRTAYTFTGVQYLYGDKLYLVTNQNGYNCLYRLDLTWRAKHPSASGLIESAGDFIDLGLDNTQTITDVYVYLDTLIVMVQDSDGTGHMYHGDKDSIDKLTKPQKVTRPSVKPTVEVVSTNSMCMASSRSEWNSNVSAHTDSSDTSPWHYMSSDGWGARLCFGYCYATPLGTTQILPSASWTFAYTELSPVEFSYQDYLVIKGAASSAGAAAYAAGARSVYVYYRMNESTTSNYVGKATLLSTGAWTVNWYGSMQDTSEWATAHLNAPEEDTSAGPDATHVRMHDSRLYYWGGSKKYRLTIGGNASNELSISRGVGGGYVDIQPGSGLVVNGTAKFKTYNGANIVTIMCGDVNTGKVKRYNLLEDQVTISSDNSVKSWSTEEVSNVVGCQSPYGFGVYADGLYSVDRYGLLVTTQALESNNQLRNVSVSSPIQPVFKDNDAVDFKNAQLCYIDEILYMCIGSESTDTPSMIFCYDTNSKSWYTYTDHDNLAIKKLFNYDDINRQEGLGYITDKCVKFIPTTGIKESTSRNRFFIETAELSARTPPTQTTYVAQMELRFDWLEGDITIVVDGINYYGQHCKVERTYSADSLQKYVTIPLRIEQWMETHKLRIHGTASFRLTHINEKLYTSSNKVGMPYGYQDYSYYTDHHGNRFDVHHTVEDYQDYIDHIGLNVT